MRKTLLFSCLLLMSITATMASAKRNFPINKEMQDECKIDSMTVLIEKEIATKTFYVNAYRTGSYYFSAWVRGNLSLIDETLLEYPVFVNGKNNSLI